MTKSKYDEMARGILKPIPSTHFPISLINGQEYYYMSKDALTEKFASALAKVAEQKDLLIDNHKNLKEVYFKEKEELQAKLSLAVGVFQDVKRHFAGECTCQYGKWCSAESKVIETLTQIKGDGDEQTNKV